MRIEKLTAAQTAALATTREEWLAHGLATGPADRAEAEAGVADAYRAAGLEPPQTVIWVDSPMAGAIAAWTLATERAQVGAQVGAQVRDQVWAQVRAQVRAQVWDQVRDQVWAQVWDQVRDQVGAQVWAQVRAQVWAQVGDQVRDQVGDQVWAQVWDQVRDQVGAQVGAQVRAQVWAQVWDQVRDQVGAQVWDQVRAQVRAQVWDQVWDQVGDQVRDQVGAQVRDQVGAQVWDQVRDQVWAQVGAQVYRAAWGQHDAGWLAFYDYFRTHCTTTDTQRLSGMMRIARSAGWWWPFQNAAILTERPTLLNRDGQGRLHSETGPALTYPDGFAIWAWHGVRVPQNLIETTWGLGQILTERNAEIRRCAIEKLGWDVLIQESGLKEVASAPDPGNPPHRLALYDLPDTLTDLYDAPARILLCVNGSPEPDGPHRRYGLPVPAHHTDPVAAAADLYGWTADEYRQLQIRR